MNINAVLPTVSQPTTTVLGQPFTRVTAVGALEKCETLLECPISSHVMTANVDFLARTERDRQLRSLLLNADEILCDGMPLVWLSRLQGDEALPERVTGSDLVPKLLELCAKRGFKVFFLGSDDSTLTSLTAKLSSELPKLVISGKISPPVGDIDSWDNETYIDKIKQAKPDLLLVALGFPKQDLWIERYAKSANIPLSIGIGASLDFLVGKQTRSPKWLQKAGLEWLWRLGTDPTRLAGRYAMDLHVLLKLIGKQLFWSITSKFELGSKRAISKRALLNGIDTKMCRVTAFNSDQTVTVSEPIGMSSGEICDLSGIEQVNCTVINTLISKRREATKCGTPFAIFSAPPALSRWLRLFKLDNLINTFDSPIALRSFFAPNVPIKIPDGSQRERAKQFKLISAELFSFESYDFQHIEVTDLHSLSRNTGNCLTDFVEQANRVGASLKIDSLSPESADIIEILGLQDVVLTN